MIKIKILLIVCFISSFSFSQDYKIHEICDLDMIGAKNGKYSFLCNDVVLREGFYQSGKRDSLWKFYNIDGQLIIEGYYSNGLKNRSWTYYEDNKIKSKIEYSHGVLNGKVCSYLSSGLPYISYNYNNSKHHGVIEIHDINGKLKERRYYKNGALDSLFTIYDTQGLEIIQILYKDGHPYSILKSNKTDQYDLYFTGNLLFGTGEFTTMIRTGHDKYIPLETREYKDSKINGNYILYNNGNKYVTGELVDNILVGKWKFYDQFGGIKEKRTYTFEEKKEIEHILGGSTLFIEPHYVNNELYSSPSQPPLFFNHLFNDYQFTTDSTNHRSLKVNSKLTPFGLFVKQELTKVNLKTEGQVILFLKIGLTGEIKGISISSDLEKTDNDKIATIFTSGFPNFEPAYQDGFPVNYEFTYIFNL